MRSPVSSTREFLFLIWQMYCQRNNVRDVCLTSKVRIQNLNLWCDNSYLPTGSGIAFIEKIYRVNQMSFFQNTKQSSSSMVVFGTDILIAGILPSPKQIENFGKLKSWGISNEIHTINQSSKNWVGKLSRFGNAS